METARDHGIDLSGSYMIGDRWRDFSAAKAAGCYTVFVDYGYAEQLSDKPDATVGSVAEAGDLILLLETKREIL